MSVYDDMGNVTNERAKELCRNIGRDVSELFDRLFSEGMTFVEARALTGQIRAEISYITAMNIMQHQMREGVAIEVHGKYPACLDMECKHRGECANHTSAGDYRTEDGDTPGLVKTTTGWQCNREPADEGLGAVLTDGTHVNEWNIYGRGLR
jgi:hypothetical protein